MTRLRLRTAEADDIAFVMSTERVPGHERFIGQWTEDQHRDAMAVGSNRYLLGVEVEQPVGFAILRELDNSHGNAYLQRIAVPKQGVGRALLVAVTDWVFRETSAHRMWFHMAGDNDRAHRVYQGLGFTLEGRLRESRLRADGSRGDALIFSMLRAEWPSPSASATT